MLYPNNATAGYKLKSRQSPVHFVCTKAYDSVTIGHYDYNSIPQIFIVITCVLMDINMLDEDLAHHCCIPVLKLVENIFTMRNQGV